jgi:hypothetical protein
MAILGSILSGLFSKADSIIDECITSKEEKLILKNEFQKIIQEQEALIEQEITKRWEADMNSDSWLSKSIRPLVLAWLVISTTLLIFVDAGVITFVVADKWVDLLQIVLITCIGAYFGSRGLEKIKK